MVQRTSKIVQKIISFEATNWWGKKKKNKQPTKSKVLWLPFLLHKINRINKQNITRMLKMTFIFHFIIKFQLFPIDISISLSRVSVSIQCMSNNTKLVYFVMYVTNGAYIKFNNPCPAFYGWGQNSKATFSPIDISLSQYMSNTVQVVIFCSTHVL